MVLISNTETTRIFVKDQSYVGAARRTVREFAEAVGLSGEPLEKLSILASEIASNLAKHASNGGEILLSDASGSAGKAVRLISIDRGPGIDDVESVLIDGVSSTQTLGAGLGALKRLSDSFEINSTPGLGTAVICSVSQHGRKQQPVSGERFEIGWLSVPHPSEARCGDAVAFAESDELFSILVVDALGHGDEAADVSQRAAKCFQADPFDNTVAIVERIHQELLGSRGAVLAVVHLHNFQDKLNFAGVGNISSRIFMRYSNKGCASSQGVVGGKLGSVKEYEHEWGAGAALLLYSDGIKSSAQIECSSPRSPYMLAAEVYRDCSRLNDDATVVVVKDKRGH